MIAMILLILIMKSFRSCCQFLAELAEAGKTSQFFYPKKTVVRQIAPPTKGCSQQNSKGKRQHGKMLYFKKYRYFILFIYFAFFSDISILISN